MKNLTERLQQSHFFPLNLSTFVIAILTAGAVLVAGASTANATSAAPRIGAAISSSQRTPLPNSKVAFALPQNDTGRLPAGTRLEGISLYFNRTQAQQADVLALIAAQQTPGSPQYHQWLTPEQFGSRFGMADSDIAKVESWLEQQGFSIDSVGNSKTMIRFSGTAAQVEQAFATEMHNYTVRGEKHFAPSTNLSVPSALAGVVLGIRNLDDFRPKPRVILSKKSRPKPAFTGSDDSLFFAPGDVAVEYDIQAAYNSGSNGAGQSIAVIGQSEIELTDIENFESAAGLPVKDPTLMLVPGTGSASFSAGDWTETDLDLEWSGAIARGAAITLVYVGGDTNYSAFDALQYAIDKRVANIVSSSYGQCEAELAGESLGSGAALQATLEAAFQQAATQGQTILSASGDDGSTDCYVSPTTTNPTQAVQQALAVDYPASSAYVTGVGGTEISQANSAYETAGSAYWEAVNTSTDEVNSVLQYIPEQAWNEDEICLQYVNQGGSPICSGGGGASSLFAKPSWQAGVAGIPADGHRDVPDVALNASIYNPGYLFCSSDSSGFQSGQAASCNSGFRDASSGDVTAAGGTSFAAPIFAGMVAIINQQQNYTTGQGLINPELYKLASDSTTYAAGFHDITTGDNKCDAGQSYCNGSIGFAAGTGYDQATGLGTIDLFGLVGVWPANTGTALIATTTTVTAANTTPTVNTSDVFTIAVTSETGATVPTGTVSIAVDGGTAVTETLTANGTYSYTGTFTTAGSHEVVATYSGDTTHATSTGSATVTIAAVTSGTGSFSLGATGVTVAQGSSASSTITVKPAGGYTGTVYISFDTSNDSALANLCYEFSNTLSNGDGSVAVASAAAVTTQLSFDTNAADCSTANAVLRTGKHSLKSLHGVAKASNSTSNSDGKTAPVAVAFAGLLLAGFLGRYARKFRTLAAVIALVTIGFAVSACGGSGNSNTVSNPSKGTYTITLTGQDSVSATIPTATTTFTLTID